MISETDYKASMRRRILRLRTAYKIGPLSTVQTNRLIDALYFVRGDGITDPDLRVMIRLTARGLYGG